MSMSNPSQDSLPASTHPRIHNLLNSTSSGNSVLSLSTPPSLNPRALSPASVTATTSTASPVSIPDTASVSGSANAIGGDNGNHIQQEQTYTHDEAAMTPKSLTDTDVNGPTMNVKQSTKKKPRRKSSTNEEKVLLSTSSPEGIAAAAAITPNRIATILIKEGPLPIRHLTGHLIQQVPAFGNLSLSKQRRLIMASLESGDLQTGCIFEKIGWGQWEAKVVGKDIVRMKIEQALSENGASNNTNNNNNNNMSSNPNSPPTGHDNDEKSPKSVSAQMATTTNTVPIAPAPSTGYPFNEIKKSQRSSSTTIRRESITSSANEHNIKMPASPTLGPVQNFRNSLQGYADIDEVIETSASDDDIEDGHSPNYETFSHDNVHEHARHHGHDNVQLPSLHKTSPSNSIGMNILPNIRSQSMSSSRRPSFAGVIKPRKPRTSFTQHTLEATLDDAPMERRESRVSFSNSANLSRQSFLRTNISPRLSNNNSSISFHDKENENVLIDEDEDDNENAIQIDDNDENDNSNFTDEEDWKSIGASTLRKNRQTSIVTPPTPNIFNSSASSSNDNNGKTVEEMAAFALMDLKTI